MLSVGVEGGNPRRIPSQGESDSSLQRCPLTQVDGVAQDMRAGGERRVDRVVGGAVVDDYAPC